MRETFLDKYQVLTTWDEKIEFVRKLKNIPGAKYRRAVLEAFHYEICEFNRSRKMDQQVRSIVTGRLIGPSASSYLKTLRACNLIRNYSMCPDTGKIHPVRGRKVYREGEVKKIARRCKKFSR